MHDFKKLDVWKISRVFVKDIYLATKHFPQDERFGLTSQLRRATVSIPSNIAEGCGRDTNPQLVHFLNIAQGSSSEVETQIMLAKDLDFIDNQTFSRLNQSIHQIQRMLRKLRESKS